MEDDKTKTLKELAKISSGQKMLSDAQRLGEVDYLKDILEKVKRSNILTEAPVGDVVEASTSNPLYKKTLKQAANLPGSYFAKEAGEDIGNKVLTKATPKLLKHFPKLLGRLGVAAGTAGISVLAEAADSPVLGENSDEIPGSPDTRDPRKLPGDQLLDFREQKKSRDMRSKGNVSPEDINFDGLFNTEQQAEVQEVITPDMITEQTREANALMRHIRKLEDEGGVPYEVIQELKLKSNELNKRLNEYEKPNERRHFNELSKSLG